MRILAQWRALLLGAMLLGLGGVALPAREEYALPAVHNPHALLKQIPHLEVSEYEVSGRTAEEIRSSLGQRGPKHSNGKVMDGYTSWSVKWSWPFTPEKKPLLKETAVTHSIIVVLPRWKERAAADPALGKKWDEFVHRLTAHELQHAEFVASNVTRIQSEIREAAENNPELTPRGANALGEKILARIRAHDEELDRVTNHGKTQGVRFP